MHAKQYRNTVEEFFDEDYDTGDHSVTIEEYTPSASGYSWVEYPQQLTGEQKIALRTRKREVRHARQEKSNRRLAVLTAPAPTPAATTVTCTECFRSRSYGIWCRRHLPESVRCIDMNVFGGPCGNRPTVNSLRCGHHVRKSMSAQFESTDETLALPDTKLAASVAKATRPARTYSVKASQEFSGNPDDFFVLGETGSRSLQTASVEGKQQTLTWIENVLTATLENHPNLLAVSCMAEGFDKAAAVKALELNIPLWCIIPNSTYGDYYWGRNSLTGRNMLAKFNEIVERATFVTTVMPSPRGSAKYGGRYGGANFDRNDFMVKVSHAFMVYDPSSAGTSHAFAAIRASGKPYKIAPNVV